MADFPVKAAKLFFHKLIGQFRESGTSPAQGAAPVVCPELANLSTEKDEK
jgi:hypothetical protein